MKQQKMEIYIIYHIYWNGKNIQLQKRYKTYNSEKNETISTHLRNYDLQQGVGVY